MEAKEYTRKESATRGAVRSFGLKWEETHEIVKLAKDKFVIKAKAADTPAAKPAAQEVSASPAVQKVVKAAKAARTPKTDVAPKAPKVQKNYDTGSFKAPQKEGTMKKIWDTAEKVYAEFKDEPKKWRKEVFARLSNELKGGTISAGYCTWKHSKGLA